MSVVRVSVIIPTNRLNEWLDEAVTSVLNQLASDDELVLVLDAIDFDDVPDWAADPRVVTTRTESSRGVGAALRHGVNASSGEFVARLDSDDVAMPGRFDAQVKYLRSNKDTVATATQTVKIDLEGRPLGRFPFDPAPDVRRKLLWENVIVQSSIMFRRSGYDAVGGYPEYCQMEDYVLWLNLGRVGRIAILEGNYTSYRLHDAQLSSKTDPVDEYVHAAIAARNALASHLRASIPIQRLRNKVWLMAHYLHSRHGAPWARVKSVIHTSGRRIKSALVLRLGRR